MGAGEGGSELELERSLRSTGLHDDQSGLASRGVLNSVDDEMNEVSGANVRSLANQRLIAAGLGFKIFTLNWHSCSTDGHTNRQAASRIHTCGSAQVGESWGEREHANTGVCLSSTNTHTHTLI